MSLTGALGASENYAYFIDAQSLGGPTGGIDTFSTKVVPAKRWSFGLHRFGTGLNYGIMPRLEAGINFDLKDLGALVSVNGETFNAKLQRLSLHSKYRLLREEEYPLDVSVGQRRDRVYCAAGKLFPSFRDAELTGGVALEGGRLSSFASLIVTQTWEQLIVDYDARNDRYNIGGRFLMSPEIKLDFFWTDVTRLKNVFFDNFIFGLSLAI